MRRKQQLSLIIVLLMVLIVLQIFSTVQLTTNTIKNIQNKNIPELSSEFELAARKATPAVVFIVSGETSGSGVIISKEGYILTNSHVIQDNSTISVRLPDKRIFSASLIGKDEKADIAVIKIDAEGLPVLNLANSDDVQVGQKVLAIGNPYGLDFTVTTGIISAKHRDRGPTEYKDFLQTDASINPGNSGGPLVDLQGNLIGINTFIVSGLYTGELGFAIPINLAKRIMDELIKDGGVIRGYLGVSVLNYVELDEKGNGRILDGAKIEGMLVNGSAYTAGLNLGDRIVEIDGKKIDDINTLRNIVAWLKPGQKVKVKAIRNETLKEFDVIMSQRPD